MAVLQKPYILTREDVKTFLQIGDTSFDTVIDTYLKQVSLDVGFLTNQQWVKSITGDLTNGLATIENVDTTGLELDMLVSSSDFDNFKIIAIDTTNSQITLDNTASVTAVSETLLINTFPYAKKLYVAQMVFFHTQKYVATNPTLFQGGLKSERVGSYSYTLADGSDGFINGYPSSMVMALGGVMKPRFC